MPPLRQRLFEPVRPSRIALFLILCLLAGAPALAQEHAKVVEIVDGDTVRVQAGRETLTVRLIGIDTPERSHPSKPKEFQADEAAVYLASLCGGKNVKMERGDEDKDRYGRLLRYLFLPPPDGRLVNVEMVRQGYARVYRRFPFSREAEFSEAEEQARREGKGVWQEGGVAEARWVREKGTSAVEVLPLGGGNYAVVCGEMTRSGVGADELGKVIREILRLRTENSDSDFARAAREVGFMPLASGIPRTASRPEDSAASTGQGPLAQGVVSWEEAHRHFGEEVAVEGTLVRTHRGKKALFLNFHSNWKKYITVVVLGRDIRKFPQDPEVFYKGKTVRVRGTVSLYNGRPEIVIRSPDAITILK